MKIGKILLVFVLFLIVLSTPLLFEYSIKEKEPFDDIGYVHPLTQINWKFPTYSYTKTDTYYNTTDKCDIVCERLGKSANTCKSKNSNSLCINNMGKKIPTNCVYYNNRCNVSN